MTLDDEGMPWPLEPSLRDEIAADHKPMYLWFWQRVLREMLGWSEARVHEWAKQFEAGLNVEDPQFYEELPTYYLVDLLTPNSLQDRLKGMQWVRFKEEIEVAIWGWINAPSDLFEADFDFKAARERVEELLAEYGESIPQRD